MWTLSIIARAGYIKSKLGLEDEFVLKIFYDKIPMAKTINGLFKTVSFLNECMLVHLVILVKLNCKLRQSCEVPPRHRHERSQTGKFASGLDNYCGHAR